MNKHYFSLLLICILQINSFTARAQLYWSESFGSYTNGQNINGLHGWDYQNAAENSFQTKTASPLSYLDLLTDVSGTYFTGGGKWLGVGVKIPVTEGTAFGVAYRADVPPGNSPDVAGYKATGSTNEFWFSALVRADQRKAFGISFHNDNSGWYGNDSKLQINRDWNVGNWSINVDGTTTNTSINSAVGITALVVCKINFEVDGTRLSVYLNPTFGKAPVNADATGKTATPQYFRGISFWMDSDPDYNSIDELRIGATFADVTPLVDKLAPSVPTGLSATGILQSSFTLNWTASTDNVGVDSYEVFKDGVSVGTTAATRLNITGLTASTTYSLTVKAKDSTGNASITSSLLSVKTSDPDIQAPSVPTGLVALTITQLGFSLSWVASTDNVSVASYEVYKNGVSVGTSITTNMNVTGLLPSTSYSFSVKAKDAVGNTSLASIALSVTTKDLDTQAPTASTALVSSAITPSGFTLNWTASNDNVGVTSYMILQDGVFLKSTNLTTATIIGLSPSSTYSITVKATDAAGNLSVASDPLSVTTLVFVPSPTSYIEDFNDNQMTGWYAGSYGLSEQNQALKINAVKASVWDGFGFSFPEVSIKDAPYVSLKIKSNFDFNISMAVGKKGGRIDNYPLRIEAIGVVGAQEIVSSGEYQEYSFDYTGLAVNTLDSISNLHFVLNPMTRDFGEAPNKEIYFDDIKIGDMALHTPAISTIQDQLFTLKASGNESRIVNFRNVNDGSSNDNPITITASSSNPVCIPDPQVIFTSPKRSGSILLQPNVSATGESVISVSVSAPNTTPKVMTFKVKVAANAAPSMKLLADMVVLKGETVTVALDQIDDGNPESTQNIGISGKSSDLAIIPSITVVHDSIDYTGTLSFTPALNTSAGTETTIRVRLKDNGGIASAGIDTAIYLFKVKIYDELNHQPTLDSIAPKSVKAIAGSYQLNLSGISDGDNTQQNLTFEVSASADTVITNLTVGNVTKGIASLNYNLTGKTGGTTITIKVIDDGGKTGNDGNKFTIRSFVMTSVPSPLTGLIADYIPFISNVAGSGIQNTQNNGTVEILADGTVHLSGTVMQQTFPACWFDLGKLTGGQELDISANKYVSFKFKGASTNKIEAPDQILLDKTKIFFRLVDNINPGAPGSGYAVSFIELNIPNDNTWHDIYLDFTGYFYKTKDGNQTDSTRITRLMLDINALWFQQIKGDYYFKDLKLGDKAERPLAIPRPTINPIPNQVVYQGQLPKPILLSGISNGTGKLTADLTAGTNNAGLISGISIGDIINGTALLKYTINASVADSAIVTIIANNTSVVNVLPDTVTFKVFVMDTVAIANSLVTIDLSKTYQTIAGIGTMLNNSDHVQIQQVKDLNITLMRLTSTGEFEPVNDNADPNVTSYSNFNRKALPTDLIRSINENTNCHKFFYSPWTPPNWMKLNKGSNPDPATLWAGNNRLNPEMYNEFAEYLVAICKTIKAEAGVELYAISLQNEPTFNEPYASCQYTGAEFRDLMKIIGPRFDAEHINTRIMMPEDIATMISWVTDKVDPVNADPEARKYLDIVAVHLYDPDGINVGGAGSSRWNDLLNIKKATTAEGLWMTETSGFCNVWEGFWGLDYLSGNPQFFPGPLDFAGSVYTSFKAGNISGWADLEGAGYKTKNDLAGSVFKNYSAFINPGAVMVDAISNNSNILSLAFKNTDNSITSILLNTSEKPVKVTMKGKDVPKVYRTFTTQNFAAFTEGATVTNGAMVLPPRSITTLTHSIANLAPTVDQTSNLFIDLNEGDKSITLSGIGYGADPGVQSVTSVSVTSGNTDVANASVDYTSDSSSALLKITPVTYGTTLINVKVKDNGGITGGGLDSTVIKFYVTVLNGINHVPTINTLEPVTMLEDADSLRISLTGISDGDMGTQLLKLVVSGSNEALIRPRISYVEGANSASLIFKPNPNLSGSSILSVLLTDNGGNENNNGNLTAKIDIHVTVLPVNDAPTIIAVLTSATIKKGALKRFPITIDDGEFDAVQMLNYKLVNATPNLVDTRITDNLNNGLTLNVTAKAAGDVILKFVLKDNGGIQNDGIDTSLIIFNIKVEPLTGINETDINNISLYPNPAHDYVYLKLNNFRADNVVITDAAGQVVLQQNVLMENNECKLSIGNLPVGLYFIKVNSGTKSQTFKFIHR